MASHFILPAIVVGVFFRRDWKLVYLIMVSTMLVDIDHLMANPVYDPGRCSIGLHPLNGFLTIARDVWASFILKIRYAGIGLVIHMALDSLDCKLTNGVWFV